MKLPSSSALPARSAWDIQRAVVFALVLRELKARAGGHWLGLMWLVFEPMAHMLVVLSLFTFVRHFTQAGLEVPVFLVTGMMPFFMFRNVALRVGDSVPANRGLFNYRQVRPADTMVSRALVEVALSSAVYLALLAMLGWLGFQWWPERPLELIGASVLLLALAFGLALVIAVATLRRPKVRSLVGLVFFPLYLLSGVIFPVASLSPEIREWLFYNPVLHYIELMRECFIADYPRMPELDLGYAAQWTLGTLALGLALYRVDRHRLRARD